MTTFKFAVATTGLAAVLACGGMAGAQTTSPSDGTSAVAPAATVPALSDQAPVVAPDAKPIDPTSAAQMPLPPEPTAAAQAPSVASPGIDGSVNPTPTAQQAPSDRAPAASAPQTAPTPTGSAIFAPPTPNSVATSPTKDTINNAKLTDGPSVKDGVSPAVLRAEILLDRAYDSPGVIDGKDGTNFKHAVQSYAASHNLPATRGLDDKVWSALLAQGGPPVLMTYVLTPDDVAGPFFPDLPKDYKLLSQLPTLGYRNIAQKVGAKFHMGEDLLGSLNPGVDLGKAGNTILVADTAAPALRDKVKRIIVDKAKSQVLGFDANGRNIIAVPATIGSQELPSPSGTYKVRGVAFNPAYYYSPKNFVQGDNHENLKLPPGPNNPVGSVFIALSKPTYGLHGTPDPSSIDKTASHGCVRMTNWDAMAMAHLVRTGVVVTFVH